MGTINFYLKKANKKGECSILMTYQQKGLKFRYFTKLKVIANYWKDQRVKTNCIGYSEINGILDDIENTIKEIEREGIFNKKEYGLETIKKKFFSKFGVLNNSNDFFKVFDKFIEHCNKG